MSDHQHGRSDPLGFDSAAAQPPSMAGTSCALPIAHVMRPAFLALIAALRLTRRLQRQASLLQAALRLGPERAWFLVRGSQSLRPGCCSCGGHGIRLRRVPPIGFVAWCSSGSVRLLLVQMTVRESFGGVGL